ncbi:MAG: hypothetical protein ABIN20_06395 [candidate division WOR-3 bacterium]
MKKFIILIIFTQLKAGILSYWGLDKPVTLNYSGFDTLKTPYVHLGSTLSLSITIFQPTDTLSQAYYSRESSVFIINDTLIFKELDTINSLWVSGPVIPVYGFESKVINNIKIIPDTHSLRFRNYSWDLSPINEKLITDIDRDNINDTVIIQSGQGKFLKMDTLDIVIGLIKAYHIKIEYWGTGKFGNGLTLNHYISIDRWWAPNNFGNIFQGLAKEEFFQIDSAPGFVMKINRSSGRGSALLESVGINESYKFNSEIKTKTSYFIDKNSNLIDRFFYDLSGKKVYKINKGIYFMKNKKQKKIKFIVIK